MSSSISLNKKLFINALPSNVWQALTDPALIKQYFFGVDAQSDWREGSTIIYKGEWQDKQVKSKGTIIQFEKEKIFKHTYWSNLSGLDDVPENYHIITYELLSSDSGTDLHLTEENLSSEEMKAQSSNLWDMIFENLKALLEKNKNY